SSHARRGEAEEETVKGEVVEPAPAHRRRLAGIGAAIASTIEVTKRGRVPGRTVVDRGRERMAGLARLAPEATARHRQSEHGVREGHSEGEHHHSMRDDGVERAGPEVWSQRGRADECRTE